MTPFLPANKPRLSVHSSPLPQSFLGTLLGFDGRVRFFEGGRRLASETEGFERCFAGCAVVRFGAFGFPLVSLDSGCTSSGFCVSPLGRRLCCIRRHASSAATFALVRSRAAAARSAFAAAFASRS